MSDPTDNNLILGLTPYELVKNTRESIPKWFKAANEIIGLASFSFALGCLGTNHPKIYASISFLFICFLMLSIRSRFPSTLKQLRDKPDKTDLEEVFLKGMESHFLSIRITFIEAPIYWLGLVFLLSVLLGIDGFINQLIAYFSHKF